MNNNDLNRVKECEIQQADVSDHCAIHLIVNLKGQEKNTLWRLNVGILNNKSNMEELKKFSKLKKKQQRGGVQKREGEPFFNRTTTQDHTRPFTASRN